MTSPGSASQVGSTTRSPTLSLNNGLVISFQRIMELSPDCAERLLVIWGSVPGGGSLTAYGANRVGTR